MTHINEIKLEGDDKWIKQFNKCSDLWQRSSDESLSAEERKEAFDQWFEERKRLELGIY